MQTSAVNVNNKAKTNGVVSSNAVNQLSIHYYKTKTYDLYNDLKIFLLNKLRLCLFFDVNLQCGTF